MTRREQIELLITSAKDELDKINEFFRLSVEQQQLDSRVLVEIKNYLGNLRSILDYLAWEVFDTFCKADRHGKVYFPICNRNSTEKDIEKYIAKNFPGLKGCNTTIFEFFKNIQPKYSDNNVWLENLRDLCNQNKHDSLSLQERRDDVMIRLAYKNWSTFYWNDGLVEFPPPDGQILLHPGGQFYENKAPHMQDDSKYVSSFGWIVQKLNNYKIRTAPDLSDVDKTTYSIEAFVVANFYFSQRKFLASMELQSFLPRIWNLKNDLYKLVDTQG